MRISLNWLHRYVQFSISPEELAQKLTSVGLEVESIDYIGKKFDNFVVGEVVGIKKHPNADKLSVCAVKIDGKTKSEDAEPTVQIVCGAPNVREGQKVAVGLVGAVVPKNQHNPDGKPFTLSKIKVRGEESNGMICSEYELGLGDDADSILVLDGDAKVGTHLVKYFGLDDVVFEIGVTPNRPDCLSHIGVAREVAAPLRKKLTLPKMKIQEVKNSDIRKNISIKIENKKDCPRYSARIVQGIKVEPSPQWLQSSLEAVGVRPINNIVDITNFVMLECGQPLHAFDYDKILGKKIIVKNALAGEKFTTLDDKQHSLSSSALMICDGEKPIAIAGVMGGINSEISNTTTSVLIESAYFDHSSIRKTSKQLSIASDASYRFERGTDPNGTVFAADRAALLMSEIAGGQVVRGVVDVYPKKIEQRRIDVRVSYVNKVLGTQISVSDIKKLLTPIGIRVKVSSRDKAVCVAPTFRPDLEQEIDIIEEIARLYSYSYIEDKMVTAIDFSHRASVADDTEEIRHLLEGMGFNEIVTNSLIDEATANLFSDKVVKIKNPISKDLSAMRPSTVCSMLQTVYYNNNYGTKDIRVFEMGRIYETADKGNGRSLIPGYSERNVLSLCLSGQKLQAGWFSEEQFVDIYDLKGVVESLLNKILLDKFHFICYDSRSALTEQTIAVETNDTYIGFLGKVKSEFLKKFSVENDVYVSELNIQNLVQKEKAFKSYVPSSKFPVVTRDLAFIVDTSIYLENVLKQIVQSGGTLLNQATLFDVFEGKPLSEGKKSFAFSLQLSSTEKTLTDQEVGEVIEIIVGDVCKKFSAELRSS